MKKLKVVQVVWEDSNIAHGWASEEEVSNDGVVMCESVGYLYSEDDKRIIIVMGFSEYGLYIERKAIPRGCIKTIKELRIK